MLISPSLLKEDLLNINYNHFVTRIELRTTLNKKYLSPMTFLHKLTQVAAAPCNH